jgi:hypothetical protein
VVLECPGVAEFEVDKPVGELEHFVAFGEPVVEEATVLGRGEGDDGAAGMRVRVGGHGFLLSVGLDSDLESMTKVSLGVK